MKKMLKLNLTLILSLIIYTGSFGQAIQVDCNGKVGINCAPSLSNYRLKVNGNSDFGSIVTPKLNNVDFANYGTRIYIQNQNLFGYLDLYGEYSSAALLIKQGTIASKALDIYGTLWLNGTSVTASDEKLKKNITSLEGMAILDKLNNIKGKKYKFKNSEEMLALQNSGQVHFTVDTINLFSEANNFAVQDKAFASESKNMNKTEVKNLLSTKYFDSARKNSGIQSMINDSIGIVVRVPNYPDKETFGLLAQEVVKEFPELVEMDSSTGIYGINYDGFIPILLEAIKAQQQQIEELKKATIGSKLKSAENTSNIISTSQTTLSQNTPNPFSDNTEIAYYLSEEVQNAAIYIYDMNGRQLKSIPLYSLGRGYITIYGNQLKAGMYLYSLITDGQLIDTKRMVLTD